ncbi:MAG: hypothetical protein JZU47_10995 [Prolixibacteraceae bacterium]|nr:hypothetical protein [Prolixibacteraceae bacterium]
MKKVNLNQSLDSLSLDYVSNAFKCQPTEHGVCGFDAYGTMEFVYFYNNGTAAYSPSGSLKDVIPFESHQDAVDFIRIK